MHNWYGIETEAEFRRQEWERAVVADDRVAQLKLDRVRPRWPRLPYLSLIGFRQKIGARFAFALPAATHPDCVPGAN